MNSNKKISYVNIWTNPDLTYAAPTETDQTKSLTHEMGHGMGLGHPDRSNYNPISASTTSVMRQGALGYSTPQSHENTDIRAMYGL